MTLAKGITNATIPMGAIGVKSEIYDTIYKKNKDKIELFMAILIQDILSHVLLVLQL